MENTAVHLPSYIEGSDVYTKLPEILRPLGKRAVLIGGKRAIEAVEGLIRTALHGSEIELCATRWYGGEASYENVEHLRADEAVAGAEIILVCGGGKAIDTGKALGELTGKPVVTFPTIASTCAATTAVSIMYHPDGSFFKPFFLKAPPRYTVIHTPTLAAAPDRYLWAGIGDTYAKYFESTMSSRGDTLEHYHRLGVITSSMCLEPLLEYGAAALADNKAGIASFAFRQTILAVIVSTGIASILLTAEHTIDYNTGLAHAIFYALTSYPIIEANHLHGEVVGFGVLILLLIEQDHDQFKRMHHFNRSVGLPTALADIEITDDELTAIIPKVTAMPDIAHSPYPITEEMLSNAFRDLAEFNKKDARLS